VAAICRREGGGSAACQRKRKSDRRWSPMIASPQRGPFPATSGQRWASPVPGCLVQAAASLACTQLRRPRPVSSPLSRADALRPPVPAGALRPPPPTAALRPPPPTAGIGGAPSDLDGRRWFWPVSLGPWTNRPPLSRQ
jgi:hypothetical protein